MNAVRPVAEVIKTLLQEVDEALNRLDGLRKRAWARAANALNRGASASRLWE
jgi:hypothetical protein